MDEQFEKTIAEFEREWQSGQPPRISDFINARSAELVSVCRELIIELVLVDMERRWQSCANGASPDDTLGGQPRLEDYGRELAPLGSVSDLPPAIIAEEYRVRQLWGDRPNYDHYVSRFPRHRAELVGLLQAIDAELAADDPRLARPMADRRPITDADPRAPLPFSDFRLQQHLGTGGMGKVYRALQISLDRPVAVKALLKSRQNDADAVDRFVREAQILARLHHPRIVSTHGLGRFPGGGYFLVMDLIDGKDLAARLRVGSVVPAEAARITIDVAEAIQYAHREGVVHCDLKPGNVLLDRDGNVFVSDFGFAHLLESNQATLPTGGTLAYMAPEQSDPSYAMISTITDVYGIGGILYHLLTGRPPTDQASGVDKSIIEPTTLSDEVSKELNRVCMKCLSTSPSERYQAAAEVIEALRQHNVAQIKPIE